MQRLNKHRISRMVQIADIHLEQKDNDKAEHYYNLALEKDKFCSGALNGLAQIHFEKDELVKARDLLVNSQSAFEVAKKLNAKGVNLVKNGNYEGALELYTKAQFVLPQDDKGPKLFFNIALCYFRWKKYKEAKEFAQIALVKDPTYIKAKNLIEKIVPIPSE